MRLVILAGLALSLAGCGPSFMELCVAGVVGRTCDKDVADGFQYDFIVPRAVLHCRTFEAGLKRG